jgi:replication factor A1
MSLEEILSEIEKQTDVSRDELLKKINQKCEQLSGLITKEGAAHLIARELGIDLPEETRKQLQIKNIVSGMKNVNVIGRIIKISPINEFERSNGKKGKVVNLFVADDTSYFRLPLWNDQVKLIEEEAVKFGDTIQIFNGISKENIFGDIEISLGRFGGIRQVEAKLPSVEELTKKFLSFAPEKTFIKDIAPGNFEIRATVVYVFKGNFLFDVCSICGNKLIEGKCSEHGEVEPNKSLVISCIVDDSTDSIRAVFFGELAERIITTKVSELTSLDTEKRYELISEKLLGKELILIGKVRKNKMFNRLELIVNEAKDLNVLEESKKLAEELELKVS